MKDKQAGGSLQRGTAAEWDALALVLPEGQPGLVTHPNGQVELIVGDGVHTRAGLPPVSVRALSGNLTEDLTVASTALTVDADQNAVVAIDRGTDQDFAQFEFRTNGNQDYVLGSVGAGSSRKFRLYTNGGEFNVFEVDRSSGNLTMLNGASLLLHHSPTQLLEAATKSYVDAQRVDSGWVDVTPFGDADWVNYGSTFPNVGYRKISNLVKLRGLIKTNIVRSGTVTMCTLPAGFRPSYTALRSGIANGTYTTGAASTGTAHTHTGGIQTSVRVDVTAAGLVQTVLSAAALSLGAGGYLSLDEIEFYTD